MCLKCSDGTGSKFWFQNTCEKVKSNFWNRNKTKFAMLPFFRDTLYSSWEIYSSYGLNALGPLCLWQCFLGGSFSLDVVCPCKDLPTMDQLQQQLLLSTIYRRCQNEPQAVDFGAPTEILRQERIRPRLVISLDRTRFFTIGLFLLANVGPTASKLTVPGMKGFYWLFRLIIF